MKIVYMNSLLGHFDFSKNFGRSQIHPIFYSLRCRVWALGMLLVVNHTAPVAKYPIG